MKNDKLTISAIDEHIDNDEGLYDWWKGAHQSKRQFIRDNREQLEQCINGVRCGDVRAHSLKYGC